MKIQNEESVVNLKSLQETPQDKVGKNGQNNTKPEGDNVQLSARAQEFNRIKDVLGNVPDVRQERVDELNKQVAEGSYKSDPAKASENIVTDSLVDLLA